MTELKRTSATGFTLIELMIVVAIVAILISVAYPSYQDQVRKARRSTAQGSLVELASFMERYFTENNTYVGAVLPFAQSPKSGTSYYALTLPGASLTATAYVLTATPSTAQSADSCGTMTLAQTGAKTPAANCW